MKTVYVIGLRGFPNIQGGIESHCENLYSRMGRSEYEIKVITRRPYTSFRGKMWEGKEDITMIPLWSPTKSGLETFVHSFIAVIYSILKGADLIHFHAIGPAIFSFIPKFFGIKVIVTHHGFDYEREKWGRVARSVLRIGEYVMMKCADAVIAVSAVASERLSKKYGRNVFTISNGVVINEEVVDVQAFMSTLGIQPNRYILSVGRIVEEKRQRDIVDAYLKLHKPLFKLVIVGGGEGDYFKQLKSLSEKSEGNIVITGMVVGTNLIGLFQNAAIFVHASSLEGNPIVLLEAMSYGLPMVVSDIDANLELGLPKDDYFKMGDVKQLTSKLKGMMEDLPDRDKAKCNLVEDHYSWDQKARETLVVYRELL